MRTARCVRRECSPPLEGGREGAAECSERSRWKRRFEGLTHWGQMYSPPAVQRDAPRGTRTAA
eukprot:3895018-Pyramimonas_sp.AAC.1